MSRSEILIAKVHMKRDIARQLLELGSDYDTRYCGLDVSRDTLPKTAELIAAPVSVLHSKFGEDLSVIQAPGIYQGLALSRDGMRRQMLFSKRDITADAVREPGHAEMICNERFWTMERVQR